MVSTAVFIVVCASGAGLAGLCLWLWCGYRSACRLRVCHHCCHQLTKFAGGRMPWCPECGGLSGPRTRWRFVMNMVRRPPVVMVALLVMLGFVAATAAGPGVSWASRSGMLGGGIMLWWCENSGGANTGMIEALCTQDGATPMRANDRRRLAKLILAGAGVSGATLGPERERALMRFAAAGVFNKEQAALYDWLMLKRSGLAFGSAPPLSAPAAGKPQRPVVDAGTWAAPVGVNVYDFADAANLRGIIIDPAATGLPSTLAIPTKTPGEKAKKPPEPEKKDKDEKVTW